MRFRGDDHSRFFSRRESHSRGDLMHEHEDLGPIDAPEGGRWDGDPEAESAAESELVRRLRTMEWPKPPPGVKERCLRELMEKIEDMRLVDDWPADAQPAGESTNGDQPPPRRSFGDTHPLTRRTVPTERMTPAGQRMLSAYRPPLRSLRTGVGSVRLASIL